MAKLTRDVAGTMHRWWRRIRQSGQIERPRELADARAWATQAIEGLRNERERVREEFAELEAAWFARRTGEGTHVPREYYYHSLAARYCNAAGWSMTALEAVFTGGLSILLLTLEPTVAATIGVAITILLALGLKGVIAPLVVGLYADRPKAGRDLALQLLMITGPIALALLTILFIVRGVPSAWASSVFPWTTAGLAVLCPVIAAALFVLAGLYGWSRQLTGRYRVLEQVERDALELQDHCRRALSTWAPAAAPSTMPAASTIAKAGVVALILAGTLAHAAAAGQSTPQAQAVTTSASATRPSGSRAPVEAVVGELWIDDSVSVDGRDRPRATQAFATVLLELSRHYNVERWMVYGFSEEPWREVAFHHVRLPRWRPPVCTPTEAARIFKMHQIDMACQKRVDAAERSYRQQLAAEVTTLQDALRGHRMRPARCTNIADLLLRVSQAPPQRLSVIVSDGMETCRKTGLPAVVSPPDGTRVAFVLIGSGPQSGRLQPTLGEQFAVQRQVLHRAAPWLRIIAPWEITETLFDGER